jgi:hypothetical protein
MTADQAQTDADRLIERLGRFLDCHGYLDVEVVCDGGYHVQLICPNKPEKLGPTPPRP